MSCVRVVLAVAALVVALAGCAKPPQRLNDGSNASKQSIPSKTIETASNAVSGFSSSPKVDGRVQTASIDAGSTFGFGLRGKLSGRTLRIDEQSDIQLRAGEVVITFDDGPRPGKTSKILDALDEYGAKATFLMLGRAAQSHPGLVREVAKRGHTIGLHTHSHGDLTKVSLNAALAEIERGRRPIEVALSSINKSPAPFFRFPYLAQNSSLRRAVNNAGMLIMDVQIDSKDYYKGSADSVLKRTLKRLDQQGKGIVLFHDIHGRTVEMLPDFLAELKQRGYRVVSLVPASRIKVPNNTQLASND